MSDVAVLMKSPSILRAGGICLIVVLAPACSNQGWDPTKNMGRGDGSDEVKFIARGDGTVDIGSLGKISRYINGQRQLGRNEEQILEALVQKQIGGYRIERLKVLEKKREATVQRHKTQTAERTKRHAAKVAKIQSSPLPAPEKTKQLAAAESENKAAEQQEESATKRELVMIDTEIKQEKSKTYVVPVNDPQGPKGRSVVLVDANNRVKGSKVYQIDRSMVDLAKVAARDEPNVAVLTDVSPLRVSGGN
ncbi:hypothetical protein [Haloferula sp. BvORR071]|uniref:hypothetical protein n=1 Tax=Haloferula sp. BvORR071 TaxID=1396141 RepID=UPI00054E7A50|nr:hypothetical protein [Haloferula sp. BvORR071]